jgi:hypothetical protein
MTRHKPTERSTGNRTGFRGAPVILHRAPLRRQSSGDQQGNEMDDFMRLDRLPA